MTKRFPYQLAMGLTPVAPTTGPLEGEALEQHIADVDRRTQIIIHDAMEKHLNPPRKAHEEWWDDYDPHNPKAR